MKQITNSLLFGVAVGFVLCLIGSKNCMAQMNSDYFNGVIQPQLNAGSFSRDFGTPSSGASAASGTSGTAGTGSGAASDGGSSVGSSAGDVQALLFAVDDYHARGVLGNLQGCNNDVDLMLAWLRSLRIKDDAIQILSDTMKPAPNQPTRDNFLKALAYQVEVPCERLVVVIACHGLSAGGKSFICPQDTTSIDFTGKTSAGILREAERYNMIPVQTLLETLRSAKAKDVLLILDACRTGEADASFMREFSDLLKDNDKSFSKSGGTFAVITSCSFGQNALEIYSKDGKAHGAFMLSFVAGLSGQADYAACYDGRVTLTEAYNYAYSHVSSEAARRNRAQTPEIFMSSSGGNMVLATYEAIPKAERESDLQFLMRTGTILCDSRRVRQANEVGLEIMNCVLDNIPNNTLACSLRGSVHRKLGNYGQALKDMNATGQKLQLYGDPSDDSAVSLLRRPEASAGEIENASVRKNSLLTVTAIDNDYFYVSEIDNVPLGARAGWIARNVVGWNRTQADSVLTATQMQPEARVVGVTPQVEAGPMPFGGTSTGGKSPMMPMNGMYGI